MDPRTFYDRMGWNTITLWEDLDAEARQRVTEQAAVEDYTERSPAQTVGLTPGAIAAITVWVILLVLAIAAAGYWL